MKRNESWWMVCSVLVPATLGGLLAGWQQARAQVLPPCILCECKEVTRWWAPGLPNPNAHAMREAGTTTDALYAVLNIGTSAGCGPTPWHVNGLVDKWEMTACNSSCTLGNPPPPGWSNLWEVTCTGTGVRVLQNRQWNRCGGIILP